MTEPAGISRSPTRVDAGHNRCVHGLGICVQERGNRRIGYTARIRRWHLDRLGAGKAEPSTFVRKKEERLVLMKRPTEKSPKIVVFFGRTRQAGVVCEPIIRIERIVPEVLVYATMEIVCSAASREHHLSSGSLPKLRCKR